MEMVDGDGVYLPQVFLDPLNKKKRHQHQQKSNPGKGFKGAHMF